MSFKISDIDWEKSNGLVPAIIQHYQTAQVLMLGYMNAHALKQTLISKKVTFYSRTKQRLWQKGESSGHYLNLLDIALDCDQDALLILVEPQGPTCHLGTASCFNLSKNPPEHFIHTLQNLLYQRKQQPIACNNVSISVFFPIVILMQFSKPGSS